MAKQKAPTPQEIYRARKQREEQESRALLPPGIINHGNTCFMNSVLQGLIATRLLRALVEFEPLPLSQQHSWAAMIESRRSPQLTNGHGRGGDYERKWEDGMRLGDVFVSVMHKAWVLQSNHRRENISPRDILTVLGRKYDQYLDFGQQDAHEFLRQILDAMRMEEFDVIKRRQPPKRNGTESTHRSSQRTISTSDAPSTSSHAREPAGGNNISRPPSPRIAPTPEKETLTSFADMVFGGQLTSILVCEKCKHVSQTYEDFNDLSLSMKPEDYARDRKRDRFKLLAKKLSFVPSPNLAAGMQIQRSSSVPPSPAPRDDIKQWVSDKPPIVDEPRRRSADLAPADEVVEVSSSKEDAEKVSTKSAASTDVKEAEEFVLVTEEKHVEFAEKPKFELNDTKIKKDKNDDGWVKLGRRISMTVGFGKGNKDRKSRTRETIIPKDDIGIIDITSDKPKEELPVPQGPPGVASSQTVVTPPVVAKVKDFFEPKPPSPQKPLPKSPLPEAEKESAARPRSISPAPPKSPPIPALAISRPTLMTRNSSKAIKPPRQPKQSPGEEAYLRQILADVTPATTNPFNMFRSTSYTGSSGAASSSLVAQNLWMKLGQIPGIEECLRMFTSVERLTGENMVGCRRCWKIANGLYRANSTQGDEVDEDSESEEIAKESGPVEEDNVLSFDAPLTSSAPASPLTTSNPELALFTHSNKSESAALLTSFGSAPNLVTPPSTETPATVSPSNHVASKPPISTRLLGLAFTPMTDHAEQQPTNTATATHGGIPIPSISTTAPESPIKSPLNPRFSSSVGQATPGTSQSGDSLHAPKVKHRRQESDLDSDDDSSVSESDESSTSAASPIPSPAISVDQLARPRKRKLTAEQRAKQVIMRAAYKRYLISTPPPVLVIHLKRFQQTSKNMMSFSNGFKKIDDYVNFPETLDLTPFLAPKKVDFGIGRKSRLTTKSKTAKKSEERCIYRLYAVVVHIGNMLGGHYVAYTALPTPSTDETPTSSSHTPGEDPHHPPTAAKPLPLPPRQWAYISDTIVRLTSLEEVLKAKAYICMYERIP